MADAFLTPSEVYTLTGYVKPSKQIERLTARGIPHEVNRFGRPVVPRDLLNKSATTEPELGPVP
jgi:hypothetical protein